MLKHDPSNAPEPAEIIRVGTRRISCNGGGGALGHPLVWYALDDGEAECGYCDRKFVYDSVLAPKSAGH
ncbi:MAG: zinc-finger domain-containing protein [Parvularculaceae bacterium]|nr:zinc-finger domain-containing protein [Parvularculaceae bacterium]